jgi:hypothetical protein
MNMTRWKGVIALCSRAQWMPSSMMPRICWDAKNQGKGQVAVVGKLCALQDCAFAVRQGSPLRNQINCAIVRLSDSGEAKGIRAKWFGN